MSEIEVKHLIARGCHIRFIMANLKEFFIKQPYPIELRKITWTYGAGAKKFGGIKLILSELEAEGFLITDTIETAKGLLKTVMLTEFIQRKIS